MNKADLDFSQWRILSFVCPLKYHVIFAFIPSILKRVQRWWVSWIRSIHSLLCQKGRCIQLFRERLLEKVNATISKDIVGGFEFSVFLRNLKELERQATEMCLRVLKESNKRRFDSYSRQEQCIDYIPYYLSGIVACTFFPTTFLEIAVNLFSKNAPCGLMLVYWRLRLTASLPGRVQSVPNFFLQEDNLHLEQFGPVFQQIKLLLVELIRLIFFWCYFLRQPSQILRHLTPKE